MSPYTQSLELFPADSPILLLFYLPCQDTGSADYRAVITAKKKVIALLSDVSDYRANYRLARFLWYFRTLQSGKEEIIDGLKSFEANPEGEHDNPVLEMIYKEFEKMFVIGDDAMKLDLAEITEQPIGDILLVRYIINV